MAKDYMNERKRKQIKQKKIIKDERQNKIRKKLKSKRRSLKESKGPDKREEKRREEKRRYLIFRGRAISKKSTLKKLALI